MLTSNSPQQVVERSECDQLSHSGSWPRTLDRIKEFGRTRCTLLLVLPLLFYLALPTRNFYWDGVSSAIDIEKRLPSSFLFHPSHLIYSLAGAWLYRLSEIIGIHARAIFILQVVNSLLAELCVLLFYKCLRLRNLPATLSVPMALIFGFSATWWRFATDANAYIPSVCFMMCAYVLIERRKSLVLAGLIHGGALLFHELALLFLPVALLRLRKSPPARCSRMRQRL